MRPSVLSISAERVLAPIRNAVLAHAGYGVIPVSTVEAALKILRARHVCAIVIANSVPVRSAAASAQKGTTIVFLPWCLILMTRGTKTNLSFT